MRNHEHPGEHRGNLAENTSMSSLETMTEALSRFDTEGHAYIICGPLPDGALGLSYQGNLRQLKAMFRHIRDTLREREKIGNHPNRPY